MCATSEMLNKMYQPKRPLMQTLHFKIRINAPAENVWKVLWNDESYRKWTAVFSEGSYALSDWQEGSRVKFLTEEGNGMFSVIDRSEPYSVMSFRHLGEIKNGVEQTIDLAAQQWSGAKESYYLKEEAGETELRIAIDALDSDASQFNEKFPRALAKVKELSEN